VTPSSVLVSTPVAQIRVLIDRAQGLHLNQAYLAGREVCVVGIFHSVPRRQVRGIAICTIGGSPSAGLVHHH
jgi:hypothetical protein